MSYRPRNPIRIVTAASLFDGHDASINMIRRLLQQGGAEVIHLGHNRSVQDVVEAALQEGAQGICLSSYQGGHMEYFKYTKDLLRQYGAEKVKIFGGGGGVIVHAEKKELEAYGIDQIFHPDDGRQLGLQGMIDRILELCDFPPQELGETGAAELDQSDIPHRELGLMFNACELGESVSPWREAVEKRMAGKVSSPLVLGVTGTGGAGKSSLVDELIQRFRNAFPDKRLAVFCVDPTKRKTGGALLGDRIRMNSLQRGQVYMRSLASRGSGNEMSSALPQVLNLAKGVGFDLIIAETSGIGQASAGILEVSDLSLYVMTSEFGAQSQLEKIDMIDYANYIAINKADHRGSKDALRDVKKQYSRSRGKMYEPDQKLPVFLTQASHFNDGGLNQLFFALCEGLFERQGEDWQLDDDSRQAFRDSHQESIVAPDRLNYLAEIVSTIRTYKEKTEKQAEKASLLGAIEKARTVVPSANFDEPGQALRDELPQEFEKVLQNWDKQVELYQQETYEYEVRGRRFQHQLQTKSLSGLDIPKIATPKLTDWGDRWRWHRLENFPGHFPYTAGVFPLKRDEEDPKRQFAGEGTPERTNRRFHYLSKNDTAKRLSTAFDSVTLYGQDPDNRPDIYGKVGESGVSICTLDDMKRLYDGFDLCSPTTSVSMTINGPAPMILAYFFNTAIDQQVERKEQELARELTESEYEDVKASTLATVRGTVQADILKEDQGQNTCIFSTDFALKMMADIQEYFIDHKIRNFYSVSISGYHIAEAGANPITQLAFTLANGFTFVEYYLNRGLKVDDFAPNLSFFFSNGLDPEYTVLGRVARRIWAVAMKEKYGANERSQKLKYHIQTSGRSLHAQEIDFNDIRTTLQALIATYDNCNSLHTNAYDEAITTPTEESVRRAMAIQMIVNKEFGVTKCQNVNQGSFFIEELTDLVEEAVLEEFRRLNERGGVLGAMESQYQRGKIQDESMYYEHLKHSGELPIVGVNTFINPNTLEEGYEPPTIEMARASQEEKLLQLNRLREYQQEHKDEAQKALLALRKAALSGENVFAALMKASRFCSLFQMTQALYEVGGQYRRNI